jgi:hypothetical protein
MLTSPGQESIRFEFRKASLEKEELLRRQTDTVIDYTNHSVCHGHHPSTDHPVPIRHHQRVSRWLRSGIVAGAIMASLVFALLNSVSLDGPPLWIWVGSIVFALLMGYLATVTVSRWALVDPLEPRSSSRADGILMVSGLAVIISLSSFLFLRFTGSEYARLALPTLAMIFEIATLLFVAAAYSLLPLYDWSIKQAAEFHQAQLNINVLNARLAACKVLLGKEDFYDDQSNLDNRFVGAGDDHSDGKPRKKPNGSATGDDSRAA